jgi:Uma2 family endonuclease
MPVAEAFMGTPQSPLVQRHRLTVEEYHRMAKHGVLAPGARVELIEGEIFDMAPIGTRHAATVKRLNALLSKAVGQRAIVSVQDPLRLDGHSEPQSDIALLKPRADYYSRSAPVAGDALLVIEVADTTSGYDRQIKVPLYASHGVLEVWVVDLESSFVRFYRHAADGQYTDVTATDTPGPTPIAQLPGLSIDLTGILA